MGFQPGITQNPDEPPVWLVLTGSSPIDEPSELSFTLENQVDTSGVVQKIEFFNFDTQAYEEVDSRTAPYNNDDVVVVVISNNPSRFVDSTTLEVKAQLTWKPDQIVLVYPWTVDIDQAIWRIVP
jgi:hypothetical protein